MSETLSRCLEEVVAIIKQFLLSEGGYDNGYYTYVSGTVRTDVKGILKWMTPKAKDELTEKGFETRGSELFQKIQEIMRTHGVKELTIRHKDMEFGVMETTVVYITETKERVSLM